LISLKLSSIKKSVVILALAGLWVCRWPAAAQQVSHLTIAQPGGFPGLPVMNGIAQMTNGVNVTWDGPSGYYQLRKKSSLTDVAWLAVGGRTLNWQTTVATTSSNAFFRVSGPSPHYLGSQGCTECHANIQTTVLKTAHAGAFTDASFAAAGGLSNPSCLACHTVGYKLPTGFVSQSATPQLANVQCENCHGPAANHAANPDDPTVIPQVEIAAALCGGCHNANPPTFPEWSASGHAAVVPDVLQTMSSNPNNIRTCGVCHSGSARLAMIGGSDPATTLTKDYNVPQTCAVCHDPHQTNAYPVQLRNPTTSFNNFELTSSNVASEAAFTSFYNANVNVNLCAQCHNDRGAAWTDTSRAPHHSLQYNLLLGYAGEQLFLPSPFPGAHSGLPSTAVYSTNGLFYLTNQCASCHMPPETASYSGNNHTFSPGYSVCLNCHDGPSYQASLAYDLSNQVCQIITGLNTWAGTQTNSLLVTNGVVAWEYTTPGGLTWQPHSGGAVTNWSLTNPVTFTGPTSAGQALIPDNIKKARFDLYLILNDGSFGVHNPIYARFLLQSAESFTISN
jgi:hypothetical protein